MVRQLDFQALGLSTPEEGIMAACDTNTKWRNSRTKKAQQ